MTKGIKRTLSLEEELIEMDRLLLASMRRNLSIAGKLRSNGPAGATGEALERYFARHILTGGKVKEPEPKGQPTELEEDRRSRRLDRYLSALSEGDFQNVMDLVKSMYRVRKPSQARKTKEAGEGHEGRAAEPSGKD